MALVEVSLDDIDDHELTQELESRGYVVLDGVENKNYELRIKDLREDFSKWTSNKYRTNSEDFEKSLRKFFYDTTGDYIV